MKRTAISLLISAAACSQFSAPLHPGAYRSAVLEIDNQGRRDLDVFAIHTPDVAFDDTHYRAPLTTRFRLGRARASSKTEFAIPGVYLPSEVTAPTHRFTSVRFVIAQVDGKQPIIDQELIVTPVDTVTYTIPPI